MKIKMLASSTVISIRDDAGNELYSYAADNIAINIDPTNFPKAIEELAKSFGVTLDA